MTLVRKDHNGNYDVTDTDAEHALMLEKIPTITALPTSRLMPERSKSVGATSPWGSSPISWHIHLPKVIHQSLGDY